MIEIVFPDTLSTKNLGIFPTSVKHCPPISNHDFTHFHDASVASWYSIPHLQKLFNKVHITNTKLSYAVHTGRVLYICRKGQDPPRKVPRAAVDFWYVGFYPKPSYIQLVD